MVTINDITNAVPYWRIAPGKFTIDHLTAEPEDLSYDENGLKFGDTLFLLSKTPRLTFAKALALFPEPSKKFRMGFNVTIGQNCTIGGAGFGYVMDEDGNFFQMPHLGNVILRDNVTIHNNVCIDRAVLGSTIIGHGTKIDNLVHVAHGVIIGENCLVTAGVIIGGSAVIGDNCFIGVNAIIKNKVKIGNNVTIGAGAVVLKDVPDGVTIVGNPGKPLIK